MGKGSTGAEDQGKRWNNMTALMALDQYKKKEPILDALVNRSQNIMQTGDIGQSGYFDPIKNAVNDQMAVAQNSAIETMPTGGAMFEELNNQFMQGGQSIIDNVLMKELDNALTIGLGGETLAFQGLGTAGQNMGQMAGSQASRAGAEIGGFSNLAGSCCFIFISGHGYLHPIVRRYRDEHMTDRNRRGYYWLSDRLVPQMRAHKWVKKLVNLCMIHPMTSYGKWFYKEGRIGWLFTPIAKGWLKVYDLLGDRPPYRRKGTMEVV